MHTHGQFGVIFVLNVFFCLKTLSLILVIAVGRTADTGTEFILQQANIDKFKDELLM